MTLIEQLRTGDKRTIGLANQVAEAVIIEPNLIKELIEGLSDSEPGMRMRCADALEKVSVEHSKLLQPFKAQLLSLAASVDQQEVQWHLAQIFERLNLADSEVDQLADILTTYVNSTASKIVKVFSLQTLTHLALQKPSLKPQVIALIEKAMETGAPSVVSKGKKLLTSLE